MQKPKLRSWLEIDTKALRHNFDVFHKIADPSTGSGQARVKLMAVVKSKAYGHGIVPCAKLFEKWGTDFLGVDDLDEALELRRVGIKKPILVFGYTIPARFSEATKNNISVTISSLESLNQLKMQSVKFKIKTQKLKLKIHLKLETGLNRQGIGETELSEAINILTFSRMLECCELEGVYSHFAAAELADQKKYKDYCNKQTDNFERMAKKLCQTRFRTVLMKHMADTAAAVWLPRSRYDMVRIGIGMYGLDPTSSASQPIMNKFNLKPVLSWYSIITQVKKVKRGAPVGYNLTEQVKKDSRVAIVPVGYWHGYPRALSGSGDRHTGGLVLVKNKRCKVLGRVCMDMLMINVTGIPDVKAGDIVTLIGPNLSAEEVATKASTINYEIVTRINPALSRCFI